MYKMKRKTSRLLGMFVASAMVVPVAGCAEDEVELCYDNDFDNYCDDDGSSYDPNSYVVINGKKEGYVKYDDSYVSSSSGS